MVDEKTRFTASQSKRHLWKELDIFNITLDTMSDKRGDRANNEASGAEPTEVERTPCHQNCLRFGELSELSGKETGVGTHRCDCNSTRKCV